MKEGHGKRHAYRTYWIAVLLAIIGYFGIAYLKRGAPTVEEVKPLLYVSAFVFVTTLPFSASLWLNVIGGIFTAKYGKPVEPGKEEK